MFPTSVFSRYLSIGVPRGNQGQCLPTFLAYLVISCFEKRLPRQNTVARLKSKILSPPNFLALSKILGWLRHCTYLTLLCCIRWHVFPVFVPLYYCLRILTDASIVLCYQQAFVFLCTVVKP